MLLEIAITLIMAKILNFLFEKFKQPGVVGEIVAGIILGPCCLGHLSGSSINLFGSTVFEFNLNLNSPGFKELAFIGIVFLLFIIGLDTDITDLKKTGKPGMSTAIFGIVIPFLFGFAIGFAFNLGPIKSMVIGAIFFATSITISMRILSDMNMLSSRVGLTLQTAGIISDIIGLFIFSLIIGQGHPLVFILRISFFFMFIILIGVLIVRYTIKKGVTRQTTMIALPVGLIICFLFAAFAEDMGLAAIIGAFAAGLIIKRTPQAGMVSNYIKTIGHTFFIPLFFVWIGASFNFFNILSAGQFLPQIIFIIIFIILGLLGNFIGGTVGAKISGLNTKESLSIGIAMIPVMGMALIIVTTSTDRGIFGDPTGLLAQQIKTATLLLIIISCLITPPILKRSMKSPFSRKNKISSLKKIIYSITEKLPEKNPIRNQKEVVLKNKQFLVNLLLGTIVLQIFLIIIQIKNADISYILVAAVSCIVGAYLGYVTLKHILLKKSNIVASNR